MDTIPFYIGLAMAVTTLLTVAIFYKASYKNNKTLYLLIGWLVVQTVPALTGFYTVTYTLPPRFLLLVIPPLVVITMLFVTAKGRMFTNGLSMQTLILLHVVRIPVELVLHQLYLHKTIPQLMTFEGRNLDILSGLTAPLVYYFGFVKPVLNKTILLIWNFICLALLVNIVATAVLAALSLFSNWHLSNPILLYCIFHLHGCPAVLCHWYCWHIWW